MVNSQDKVAKTTSIQTLTLRRWLSSASLLVILSLITVFLSMLFGSDALRPREIISAFLARVTGNDVSEVTRTILFQIRLPRILLAAIAGGSLAAAGGMFQAILKNPLADAYILGISSGAALGVVLSLFVPVNLGIYGLTPASIMAFTGALITLYIVYKISIVGGKIPPHTILLSGVMINAIIFAVILFLTLVVNSSHLYRVFFWLLGYLSSPNYTALATISIFSFTGMAILLRHSRSLNILTLGDDAAETLGLDVESVKRKVFIAGALLVASAVAICGPIGFVGIMVPHAVRLLVGYDYRLVLPVSFIGGGIFLMLADTFARTAASPVEIPVGIITSLSGGPFFLYLLRKKRIV